MHPEAEIEAIIYYSYSPSNHDCFEAGDVDWDGTDGYVIAFRVIKRHKGAREFWAKEYPIAGCMIECAQSDEGARLFREVIEE